MSVNARFVASWAAFGQGYHAFGIDNCGIAEVSRNPICGWIKGRSLPPFEKQVSILDSGRISGCKVSKESQEQAIEEKSVQKAEMLCGQACGRT
ncbi:MAG TPA: hypothetical protein VEC99_06025 [Clostridia bacterium]|nr:hypothetical protein [Clostridia bacterium]